MLLVGLLPNACANVELTRRRDDAETTERLPPAPRSRWLTEPHGPARPTWRGGRPARQQPEEEPGRRRQQRRRYRRPGRAVQRARERLERRQRRRPPRYARRGHAGRPAGPGQRRAQRVAGPTQHRVTRS